MNTVGQTGDCWQTRKEVCNPNSTQCTGDDPYCVPNGAFLDVDDNRSYADALNPRGIYYSLVNKGGKRRYEDRSIENLKAALICKGAVDSPNLPIGFSAKVRLAPDPVPAGTTLLSVTKANVNRNEFYFFPKSDPALDTSSGCTDQFDVHVPLTVRYYADNTLLRFRKGKVKLQGGFAEPLPLPRIDLGFDKLELICLPSKPDVASFSLSSIIPEKNGNDYCWATPPAPGCPVATCAPPLHDGLISVSCGPNTPDNYFPGCWKQVQNWHP